MELKLEKKCSAKELIVGNRYSISEYPTFYSTVIVKMKIQAFIKLTFLDGVEAGIFEDSKTDIVFYEMPFTPLEQELL